MCRNTFHARSSGARTRKYAVISTTSPRVAVAGTDQPTSSIRSSHTIGAAGRAASTGTAVTTATARSQVAGASTSTTGPRPVSTGSRAWRRPSADWTSSA